MGILDGKIELPPTADFHVHLRDGEMMEMVAPTIKSGGVDTVYVMPNLQPPVDNVKRALAYREALQAVAPDVKFLMTLYLNENVTTRTIAEASAARIAGVKVYPAGVTTNSAGGVLSLERFDDVFEAMQEHDMVLNLHGERPSTSPEAFASEDGDGGEAITVLNAEEAFLPTLLALHRKFPTLRIVLEHCTTRKALQAVRECGPTVAATITAHHLWLTVDDWCTDVFSVCKPLPKTPADRVALICAVLEQSDGKFFFGSDSAPHPFESKKGAGKTAAGCFTQGWTSQLVIGAVEEAVRNSWIREEQVTQKALEDFLSASGKAFYKLNRTPSSNRRDEQRTIVLEKKQCRIPAELRSPYSDLRIVPFRANHETWSLEWKSNG